MNWSEFEPKTSPRCAVGGLGPRNRRGRARARLASALGSLYDPSLQRIPAASASSPTSRSASPHQIVSDAIEHSVQISSIAAPVAPIPRAGDGAGILVQIPHAFSRRTDHGSLGFTLPRLAPTRRRSCFHADGKRRGARFASRVIIRPTRPRTNTCSGAWLRRCVRQTIPRSVLNRQADRAPPTCRCFIGRGAHFRTRRVSKRRPFTFLASRVSRMPI